ncbi:MAG: hypothetical protein WAP23_01510 [Candidatus Spechtbacterales bacterium]
MKDNSISGKYRKKIEKPKKEEQEYGPGKKDFVVCSDCNAIYYQKSWHHGFADYKHLDESKPVSFSICPACQMIKDKKFEGKVVIENILSEHKDEILNNIKNTGERAYKRDPMDRIIGIRNYESAVKGRYNVEVITTENQLARNIARQVERAYGGVKSEITWSKQESVARIVVKFL